MSAPTDILLTGIPRCGTTLACALLDALPDTVCLSEPAWQTGRRAPTRETYARFIADDFSRIRKMLLAGQPIENRRAKHGGPLTNYFCLSAGQVEEQFEIAPYARPDLSPQFTLAMKHNGPYLAVLDELIKLGRFSRIVALIRHPVPVIASWRRLAMPISRGEMPHAAMYWPEMATLIATPMELLEKQVRMYDLMCEQLYTLRDHIQILQYENFVRSPQLLADYMGLSANINNGLITLKTGETGAETTGIEQAVHQFGHFWRYFYG